MKKDWHYRYYCKSCDGFLEDRISTVFLALGWSKPCRHCGELVGSDHRGNVVRKTQNWKLIEKDIVWWNPLTWGVEFELEDKD